MTIVSSSLMQRLARPAVLIVMLLAGGCDSPTLLSPDAAGDADGETQQDADAGSGTEGDSNFLPDQSRACNPASLSIEDRGLISAGDVVENVVLKACGRDRWAFTAARGSKIEISLTARGYNLLVAAINYPDDTDWNAKLDSISAAAGLPGKLTFLPPRSGEFFLQVRSIDPEQESSYDLQLDCIDGCDLHCSRFPIVLVHGWTGFDQIGPIEYFYNVPDMLGQHGFAVLVAVLDPYNSVEVRSEQLAAQLDDFLEVGRARKLNIIAHSQGGLDSRRAISTMGYGDRVDALVTIATPHGGTPIADIALGLGPGPAETALAFLLNLLGAAGGNESDALASFESISSDYVQNEFNPENPDDPRVSYISWTGLTCPLGIRCGDICDVEIRWAYDLIYLSAGDNDGMVPVSSAPWGDYRGTIPADHFDEIGQVLGVTGPNFDHLEFYLGVAEDLAAAGH
ncbi:MAG TPA: triacylglycerol lipase [Myxococcota bacterium]|nr:triacylglycerol lipase [Myxococcota bacterium]